MFPSKPADTFPGHEERKLRFRLARQYSIQKDCQWGREVLRLGGALFSWLELEQQLQPVSVPLSSVHTLLPAQLQSWHAPSSLQLDGSYSTDCDKPVLLKHTPVQLSGTSTAPVSAEGCVNVVEGGKKQGDPDP